MNTISSDWLARYRFVILILSLIVGLISAYYNADLFMIPFMGIMLFFIPNMLRHRYSKEVYYLQISRFFLLCMSLVAFLFTYIFLEDIVGGKKSLADAFNDFKGVIVVSLALYALFFFVALVFGFLWKRILNFDRVHLRVLINQFSLPIIAFGFLSLSVYIYFTDQISLQKDETQWYHLLILPALLIIPWASHMFGLHKMAKDRGVPFPHFLYSYEWTRLEAPEKFGELQIYSRRLSKWVIILPLCLLFFYQMFVEKDFGSIIAGLLVVSVVIFQVYKRSKLGN